MNTQVVYAAARAPYRAHPSTCYLLERLPEPVFRALPRLRELVLTGNRLAHLPPHLGLLTALEALRVGRNALEEVPALPTTPPHPAPSPHTVPSPPPPHLW